MIFNLDILPLKLKKLVKSLHSKKDRDESGLFIAEGEKICSDLLKSNYEIKFLIVKDDASKVIKSIVNHCLKNKDTVFSASSKDFLNLSDSVTPQGIIAIVKKREYKPEINEPFIALDGISDPGNVGTIIRTAQWFGFNQVLVGKESADPFNPKAVRATMGAIFYSNIFCSVELPVFIKENFQYFNIFGASLEGNVNLGDCKPENRKFGLVFGSESHGISKKLKEILTSEFIIEGKGKIDSLNVAVSAGIGLNHFSKYL